MMMFDARAFAQQAVAACPTAGRVFVYSDGGRIEVVTPEGVVLAACNTGLSSWDTFVLAAVVETSLQNLGLSVWAW